MDAKKLALGISEMLTNGLHQLHRTKKEGGHDDCYSLEDVEAFCRERANNIAQALHVDVPAETEPTIPQAETVAQKRWGRAQELLTNAIRDEGTPAIKDKYLEYLNACEEAMVVFTQQTMETEQALKALRAAVVERL